MVEREMQSVTESESERERESGGQADRHLRDKEWKRRGESVIETNIMR